jgi:hypothetical protein
MSKERKIKDLPYLYEPKPENKKGMPTPSAPSFLKKDPPPKPDKGEKKNK